MLQSSLLLLLHGLAHSVAPVPSVVVPSVVAPSVLEPGAAAPVAGEWVELFDGKTLSGWTQRNGTATYEVRDGAIVGTTSAGSPNSFLCSDRFYGDFELEFEVKLFDDQLNSGVQIRSHSIPTVKNGRVHGPQVEVATNGHAGFIYDEAGRGWLSKDRDRPSSRAAFQRGEWNRYRVICFGQSIRTWVNDVPVAHVTDAVSPGGFIGLQVHSVGGDPKWQVGWRNLRLRELGDGGGWASLFNGRDLSGWKVAERPESARVEKGCIVVNGDRAHVFYDGPVYRHAFKNFELRALVRTKPGSNSGIYFHTEYQDAGWPSKGYEVQVNNSQGDWRRTGGLYGIDDLREPPAEDDRWFPMHVKVVGKRVQVSVNDRQVIDYTEPDDVERPDNFAGRLVDRGTFALQAHDPGSEVWFKAIEVRPLPE